MHARSSALARAKPLKTRPYEVTGTSSAGHRPRVLPGVSDPLPEARPRRRQGEKPPRTRTRTRSRAAGVTPALARFALHLAGTINVFLLERWLEAEKATVPENPFDDEMPF